MAHQKAWSEAAAANQAPSQFPTYATVPDSQQQQQQQYQPQQQHNQQQQQQNQYQGQSSNDQYQYKPYVHQEEKYDGPTGPPRGFYYSFDYPVHLIKERQ